MDNRQLYLVGEVLKNQVHSWAFQGIYSTIEKAEKKCLDENFFIAKVELVFDETREIREFDWSYYPQV